MTVDPDSDVTNATCTAAEFITLRLKLGLTREEFEQLFEYPPGSVAYFETYGFDEERDLEFDPQLRTSH